MKIRNILFFLLLGSFLFGSVALAQGTPPGTIGEVATKVTESFEGVATLMIAVAYIAGIGFVLAAIFKFKQHKDNPTQIPLGTPLAMLVIGVVLIFLPNIFAPAGESIFGAGASKKAGGLTGGGLTNIPGAENAKGGK